MDKELLKEAREALKICIEEEESERAKMLDDLKFCTLDQWPSDVRNEREDASQDGGPRPCLTVDKINQYIVQVVNDARQGKPGINVRPQDDKADVETAKILKGLIRNIEDQSKADIAYSLGVENAVKIGLGYWRITTDYTAPDSFDQDIFIKPIPNTFSVYLGKHFMPDGSDAKCGFIIESLPKEKFKEQYPNAKSEPDEFEDLGDDISYWHTTDNVNVVEYYCLKRVETKIHYLADGTTISDEDYGKWPEEAGPKPPVIKSRPSFVEKLKWVKMTGVETLDERDLPGKYIPIVECVGRESWVDGKRVLWGLVRPAKDSLRMYNYWASTITEKMALAPKTPWVAAEGQIAGREPEWRDSNKKNRAVLQYKAIDVNGNALPPPQRQPAMPIEAAMTQHLQIIENDVRTALGIFKAGVGESESQQSGRAILALQRESDTGTYHFSANEGISIRHTGRIIVDMIPHYYDTKRIVRILGEDGEVQTVQMDPSQEEAMRQIPQANGGMQRIYNPGVGQYDVAITVGPSYNTKRMEAAATLTEVVKSQPQLMPFIGDLLFRSLDFPYSDQIAQRMKKMLPPQLQDSEGDPMVKLMQAMQKMQMMGQQMQEMQQENMQLKAGAQEGMAKVQIQAKETEAELALQKQKQDGEIELARAKASAEIEIKKAVAEAEHQIKIAELTVEKQAKEQQMAMECEHKARQLDFDRQAGEQKMSMESDHKMKQLEFDKQIRHEDMMAKQASDNEKNAASIQPKLEATFAGMQKTLDKMLEVLMNPPARKISIGDIQTQTDASGKITGLGASVRPTIQ